MKLNVKLILGLLFFIVQYKSFSQCSRFPYPYSITMPDCNNGIYTLQFEDNFNGTQLDLSTWELQAWGQGSLQGEISLQLYTLDNIDVSSGSLKIIAKNQPVLGKAVNWKPDSELLGDGLPNLRWYNNTSSNIWSKKNDFLYGKYEIRCRISNGKGLWPAFWTYSGDAVPGGPIWCENDFFEIYHNGDDGFKYTNNLHFDLNNDGVTAGEQCKYATGFGSYDFTQWHTFTIYYEEDKIEYFIDNNFINRKTRYVTTNGQPLFCGDGSIAAGSAWDINGWPRQPGQLILNMAIETGNNAPNASNIFPAEYEIDYVRYWEKEPIPVPCFNNVVIFYPFNFYHSGADAYLFGNAKVLSNQAAIVEAQNQIHILPNFHAEAGSLFNAKINHYACGNFRLGDTTNTTVNSSNEYYDEKVSDENKIEVLGVNSIHIYPNPNNDGQFLVELGSVSATSTIAIYDIMGKLVWSKAVIDNKTAVNIANQPKGIYLVKLISDNQVYTEKLVYQ